MANSLRERKILPRNATAKSHYWVTGNPVTTRPETGVDNSFPGLEFDQRNLDKRFFPGLEFELHAAGILRSLGTNSALDGQITPADLTRGVQLYAVRGRFGERDGGPVTVDLRNELGLDGWRVIHDLSPGPVQIALGPLAGTQQTSVVIAAFDAYVISGSNTPQVTRSADGTFSFAFATAERSRYLDENGVIDPAEYRPGDLTRSLCSPWQYDFALCGCFYWASNKPDMVQKDADSPQFSNLQRRRGADEPPVAPITSYSEWRAQDLTAQEMIQSWETIPAVFDGVEGTGIDIEPQLLLPTGQLLSRQEVITALRELAPVEHGLMVEYLYAYYSIDPDAFPTDPAAQLRLREAADNILSVAIDEMRHFRWVNEMLLSLGEPHELGRFVDMPDADHDGRHIEHTFALKRLSPARLEWFIAVEKPSDEIDLSTGTDTIDGMYTRLLLSVSQGTEFSEVEKSRLLHLIKLVIDEGYDHFTRFKRVRDQLAGLDPAAYLRLPDDPTPLPQMHPAHVFELVVDAAYQQVLKLLAFVLTPSNVGNIDALILGARELMYNLDEAARTAAANQGAPLFRLAQPSVTAGADAVTFTSMTPVDFIESQIEVPDFATLREVSGGESLANSMETRLRAVLDRYKAMQ